MALAAFFVAGFNGQKCFRFAPIDLSVLQNDSNYKHEVQPGVQSSQFNSHTTSQGQKDNSQKKRKRWHSLRDQMELSGNYSSSVEQNSKMPAAPSDKVPTLMAACHLGLEHNVSRILWRKVRTLYTTLE